MSVFVGIQHSDLPGFWLTMDMRDVRSRPAPVARQKGKPIQSWLALPRYPVNIAGNGFSRSYGLERAFRFKAYEGDEGAPRNLDSAARTFSKGIESGVDAEDLVAASIGATSSSELTDVQERYKEQVRNRLEERAEELKREKESKLRKFAQGKAAYARGQYPASVVLLEQALNEEGPFTQLGGEVQLWLAMAYAACGREKECIDMYKCVEDTHPMPALRRQAADLRYIMEAPKLVLSEEEKVSIPVLDNLDPASRKKVPINRSALQKPRSKPKSWDEEFWENYRAPTYLKNRYVWVAAAIIALGLAYWSTLQQSASF